LRVLEPVGIQAAREAHTRFLEGKDDLRQAIELDLQAARYQAERAGKQYDQVDPENRLVADELENRWNAALEHVRQLETKLSVEVDRSNQARLPASANLNELASWVAEVWEDPRTDIRLKKRIIRTLVEEIVVDVDAAAGEIRLLIHWIGDIHTEARVGRRKRGQNSLHTDASAVEAVCALSCACSDELIAGFLNRNGLRTGKGNRWTRENVAALRSYRGITKFTPERRQTEGWMTLTEASQHVGISTTTLRIAAEKNELPSIHPLPDGPWLFRRDDLEENSVKALVQRVKSRQTSGAEPDNQQLNLVISGT